MSPQIKIIGFGSHGHVQKSRNHEDDGFSVFPIMKAKQYESEITYSYIISNPFILSYLTRQLTFQHQPSQPQKQ